MAEPDVTITSTTRVPLGWTLGIAASIIGGALSIVVSFSDFRETTRLGMQSLSNDIARLADKLDDVRDAQDTHITLAEIRAWVAALKVSNPGLVVPDTLGR